MNLDRMKEKSGTGMELGREILQGLRGIDKVYIKLNKTLSTQVGELRGRNSSPYPSHPTLCPCRSCLPSPPLPPPLNTLLSISTGLSAFTHSLSALAAPPSAPTVYFLGSPLL